MRSPQPQWQKPYGIVSFGCVILSLLTGLGYTGPGALQRCPALSILPNYAPKGAEGKAIPTATGKLYGNGLLNLLDGGVVWGTDDIYLALAATAYSLDIDTHDNWDDVSANEVTGTGWSAGGVQADGEALSLVTANNDVEFDITDESTSTVTLTDGKDLIVYSRTNGTDATRELVGYAEFDVALAPAGGTLLLDFATTGFVLIDYT